jgi:hypothetical protein
MKLLDTFSEFHVYVRKKNYQMSDRGNNIWWVAAMLVGRSERGNKQCFVGFAVVVSHIIYSFNMLFSLTLSDDFYGTKKM